MEALIGLFVLAIYFVLFLFLIVSSIITSIIYGFAVGAIPLLCGFLKKKKGFGFAGFFVCAALYWVCGFFLAQIAAAVFVLLIVKEKSKE